MKFPLSKLHFPDIPNPDALPPSAKIYAAGGCVRDLLMDKTPRDWDFMITGASPEDMEAAGLDKIVGQSFPVYIDNDGNEIALSRTERKTGLGYHGFSHSSEDVSVEEDLGRRDFTMNAMAIDLDTGELVDPYNGFKAVQEKKIHATTSAFKDDPLRVVRAARFAARYGFDITEETIELARSVPKEEYEALPGERIGLEFTKAYQDSPNPSDFLINLERLGALQYVLPEISAMKNLAENPTWHPEGTTFSHVCLVVDAIKSLGGDPGQFFACLFHDVGKPSTMDDKGRAIDHEEVGMPIAAELCDRLRLTSDVKRLVLLVVRYHQKLWNFDQMKPGSRVDMFTAFNVMQGSDLILRAFDCAVADHLGRGGSLPASSDVSNKRDLLVKNIEQYLSVTGKDVVERYPQLKGSEIGNRLRDLRAQVVKRK